MTELEKLIEKEGIEKIEQQLTEYKRIEKEKKLEYLRQLYERKKKLVGLCYKSSDGYREFYFKIVSAKSSWEDSVAVIYFEKDVKEKEYFPDEDYPESDFQVHHYLPFAVIEENYQDYENEDFEKERERITPEDFHKEALEIFEKLFEPWPEYNWFEYKEIL